MPALRVCDSSCAVSVGAVFVTAGVQCLWIHLFNYLFIHLATILRLRLCNRKQKQPIVDCALAVSRSKYVGLFQVNDSLSEEERQHLANAFAQLGKARTFPRSSSRGYSRLSWGPL